MSRETVKPTITVERFGCGDMEVHNHDAFGMITLTNVRGGGGAMFGSDVDHDSRLRISIHRAKMNRNLSNDWLHHTAAPMIEFEMSHAQFAEFITSVGNGSGTPVTLTSAPVDNNSVKQMPAIARHESKLDTFKREIKAAAKERMEAIKGLANQLGAMLDGGSISKKDLRFLQKDLARHAEQTPGSMEFVVGQAEEALEKATTHAKIEVEAYIRNNIARAGIDSIESRETFQDLDLKIEVLEKIVKKGD